MVSKMDFMRKILSSPLTRRRGQSTSGASSSEVPSSTLAVGNGLRSSPADVTDALQESGDALSSVQPRYFGVELSELVSRDGTDVPRLLLKLARSICIRGACLLICCFLPFDAMVA